MAAGAVGVAAGAGVMAAGAVGVAGFKPAFSAMTRRPWQKKYHSSRASAKRVEKRGRMEKRAMRPRIAAFQLLATLRLCL
jgi:hypothetical protein